MKKFLFLLVLLPFVSFGITSLDVVPNNVRVFTFVSLNSLNDYTSSYTSVSLNTDDPFLVYSSTPFGLAFSGNHLVGLPNFNFFTSSPTNSSQDINYPIRCTFVDSNSRFYASPFLWDSCNRLFSLCVNLYLSGYRGPGAVTVSTKSNPIAVNFNFPVLVSDILSSTNTTFRQILLSNLSSIQSSVASIDTGVSALSAVLSDIRDINSSISSNTASVASYSSLIADNTSSVAQSFAFVASNTTAIAESSSLMASNTTAIVDSSASAASNTAAIAESSSLMASNTTAIVDSSSFAASNTASIAESSKAISDNTSSLPDSLDKIFNQVYDSNGMTGNILSELYGDKELIRYISAALSGDPSSLPPNNPFFPYDPNDPTDPNHPSNPNSPLNPHSPNSLTGGGGLGAFTTNKVVRPITNVIDEVSQAIQSNATHNADTIRKNDDLNWQNFMDQATGDGPGLNVRIVYPLSHKDVYSVKVEDQSVVSAIERHYQPLREDLKNFADNVVSYLQGGVDVNLPSNLLDDVISPLYDLTNRPSYLLLDNYADYISNGVYSASVSAFIDDFPGVYSNLLHYGLVSDGDGNFWTLFGANLLYQSGLIGSLLNDMALVRSFCDDHMDGGLSGGVSNITSRLPSLTEIEDWLNTYTGLVSEVELASTNFVNAFNNVTSYSHSVFAPFEGSFDSVPTDLVLFKLPGERYVTVPVTERMDVWRLLRYGLAFALVAVNFILFPKFVLMLVVFFSKLSDRFVRFLPTDR